MKKNINVLMVGSDLSVKGGMTTVVENFLNNKFKKNINIIYIATHIEGKKAINKSIFFISALFKIIYNLVFNNISIIHVHLSERGSFYRKYLVFIVGKIFNKKIIIHMHGAEFEEFYNKSCKIIRKNINLLLKNSDKVIVLGDKWNEFVIGINPNINSYILRNSVKYSNERCIFDKININILFLAVLIERKGIFDLVKAAKILLENENLSKYNIKFLIAGSGLEERNVKKQVKSLNIEKYFEFKGWVKLQEKEELLKKSQIFVLPSYNEGLPVAILEAMNYGLSIISTKVGSIEDAVKDNYNGFLINPGDVNQLSRSIEKLIIDSSLREEFSKNSKKVINDSYDELDYFSRVEKLYYGLVR